MNKQDDFLKNLSRDYVRPKKLLAPKLRAVLFLFIISIFISVFIILNGPSLKWKQFTEFGSWPEFIFGFLASFYGLRIAFLEIIPGEVVSIKNKIISIALLALFLVSIGLRLSIFPHEVMIMRAHCEVEALVYGVFTFGLSFCFLNKGLIQEVYKTLLISSIASTTIVGVLMQVVCRGDFWHGLVFHYFFMWGFALVASVLLAFWYRRKLV